MRVYVRVSSFRMNESFSPRSYAADLKANDGHILALVGEDDEASYVDKFEQVFSENAPHTEFKLIQDAKHLDLPDAKQSAETMIKWFDKTYKKKIIDTRKKS